MRYGVWIIALGAVFALQHRDDIQNWLRPPAPITVPAGFQAVLYATEWCGYCARTRKLFSERKIPFREYDIEKSAEGEAQYEKLGGNGVPLIIIKDKVIRGYDKDAIEAALQKL
ncbi:MAG TPA: glutaredoxin family protein [Spongiibacteraceae bacterium]|jgi:glutaredoxin